MHNLLDPKQTYEIFRLQWMINHGYSVLDLLKNLEAMIEEDQNESGVRTSLESLFQDWEFGIGFDGSIWPCYEEFLEHDYPLMLNSIIWEVGYLCNRKSGFNYSPCPEPSAP